MAKSRGITLVLAILVVVITAALPYRAAGKNEKEEQNIWTEDEDRGPGPGPGQGPGPERGQRRGPGRGRFDLTDEEINRIMEGLKQRSPEKAKELEDLREKDPERFQQELRRHASDEFGKVVRERIEKWREQRQAEFVEWLQKSLPKEAEELVKLKDRSPDLYGTKYELAWRSYGRIFEESRRSPELAEVLLDDLKLQRRTDELSAKIKAAKNEREKKKLTAELEEVVGLRYDLIVRKKQMAYARLLEWLEELQNRIKESRAELGIWQDSKTKDENVKKRVEYLLEGKKGFNWD